MIISLVKIKNKYKLMSLVMKASLWFVIMNIIQRGIQFLGMPIFTRIMNSEQYGIYSTFQSWFNVLIIFTALNIYGDSFNRAMIKYEDRKSEYTSSVQGLSILLTMIYFFIYLFFSDKVERLFGMSKTLMMLMFVQLVTFPFLQLWSTRQRYEYKYKSLVIITIINVILTQVLGVIFVIFTKENKAESLILASVLVQTIISLIMFLQNQIKGKKFFDKEFWKFTLKFNIPLVPHYLSQIALSQADRIMINRICGSSEAGIYNITYQISQMMTLVRVGINGAYVPWLFNAIKNKNYIGIKKITNIITVIIFVMVVITMIIAPEIIYFLVTPEYYESIWIIPPVAGSVFFMYVYTLYSNIEFYFEKTKFAMIASLLVAIFNIVVNAIYIPKYGFLAAGYTTFISYMLFVISHYFYYTKICKDNFKIKTIYDDTVLLILGMVMVIIILIMLLLYKLFIIRYILLLGISIIIFFKKDKIKNMFMLLKSK